MLRPALLALVGLVLAVTAVPVLAGPAHAADVVVQGTVTGVNGVKVQDVFVEANDANGNPLEPRRYDYTGTDGTYSLSVPAGSSYVITMECANASACEQEYAPEPRVTQTISAATTLNATMDRWGRITGTVRKNGVATAWPTGKIEASNDARNYWSSDPGVSVGANGAFTIEKVAPGTVTVRGNEPWDTENSLTSVPNQTVSVTPGATATMNLAVEDWKGFYVRAVDPNGAPLEKVTWNVFSRTPGGAWDNGLQYGPLWTDAAGRMSFRITDGKEYTVCFFDTVYDSNHSAGSTRPNRYGDRCWGNAPDLASATAWQPTAQEPKLKQDVTLPLIGKSMQPGHPWTTGTGATTVGTPITVEPGLWAPAGVTLSWQWKYWNGSQMVAIPGATSPTYTPTADMVGKRPVAYITGTAPGYAPATVTWGVNEVNGTAPTMTGTLSITGPLTVGSTATANAGTFTPSNTDTTWWWYLDGLPIFGAQGNTIEVTEDMLGRRLEARLTAYAWSHGDNEYFNRVSVAVPGALKGSTPAITGTTTVGSTLTAHPGTWTSGATLSYQWRRAGAPISGATSATYPLVADDQGKAISVTVTGKLAGYSDVAKTSAATAAVAAASFTSTPAPTVSGTTQVGSTLTANVAAWTPTATMSYQWLRAGADIPNATGATYALVAADQGKAISVRVVGARAGYTSVTKTSAATAAVGAGTFTATPVPTIAGTRTVGSTLSATVPAWTPAATGTTYQWLRAGTPIAGATAATYALVADDLGKAISVRVTGTREGYTSSTQTSAATEAIAPGAFTATPAPIVSGTKTVGSTLSAALPTWTPAATTTTYQWLRAGAEIPGATSASYVLVAADLGKAMSVRVTGSRAGYTPVTQTSAATTAIGAGAFTAAPAPTIAGTPAVGELLTAAAGTWQPEATTTTFQWLRGNTPIDGATASTYRLVAADAGQAITVTVTGARDGYAATSRTSEPTATVLDAFTTAPTPTVSGTRAVGSTLTANAGTWAPTPGGTTYQWLRNGVAIPNATARTYRLTSLDGGRRISVRVTASLAGYATKSVTSAATGTILRLFTSAPAPRIVGTTRVRYTLTASLGTWSPTPSTTTYRWYRNGVAIAGATARSYKLTSADRGKRIKVVVKRGRTGYVTTTRTSASTRAIS